MKKILLCLLTVCFLFSFDASAYTWTYVGKESNGTTLYLDKSSIRDVDSSNKSFFIKIENQNGETYSVVSVTMDKDEERHPGNLSFGTTEVYRASDGILLDRGSSRVYQPIKTKDDKVLRDLYDIVWGKETREDVSFRNGIIGGVGKALALFLIGCICSGIAYLWRKARKKNS